MESIREEIRKETSLCIFYMLDIAEKTKCCAVSNASNYCVKSNLGKFIHKWLHADPVIAHEHHGFLAILMNNIYHLFCKKGNLSALECLEITEFLRRDAICIIHISLVDNVFRTERIACFLFKLFQDIRTY